MFLVEQLRWIAWLQQVRTPAVDHVVAYFNYLDSQEFLFVVLPAVWIGYHWKAGARLFYAILLNTVVNVALKGLFQEPRPFELDPSLAIVHVGDYGFPSGGAQTAMLLAGLIVMHGKNGWKWGVAIPYLLIASFSRIFLGVHFPTDVLGGWVAALFVLGIYAYAQPRIEKSLARWKSVNVFFLSQCVPLLLVLWQSPHPQITGLIAVSSAVGLGMWLCTLFHFSLPRATRLKEWAWRAAIGVCGTFLLYVLISLVPVFHTTCFKMMRLFLLSFWLSFGGIVASLKFGYRGK